MQQKYPVSPSIEVVTNSPSKLDGAGGVDYFEKSCIQYYSTNSAVTPHFIILPLPITDL
jgi:hypothetical protein